MLESIARFFGEIFIEGIVEGLLKTIFRRIEDHPYYTCIYRGFAIAVVVFIGLIVWHIFQNADMRLTLKQDIIISLAVWLVTTLLLMLWTAMSPSDIDRP